MQLEKNDLLRLSMEVRRFLNKGDLMTRLSTMAKLYLEFPDVGSMRAAHVAVMRSLVDELHIVNDAPHYVDDHTIEIQVAGVSIILSSKQRFMTMRGSVGYRDIAFVDRAKMLDE